MNVWQMLREYINNKNIGDTILRKDIIFHVYKGPMPEKHRNSYGSTLDNYRRLLTRLGILKHIGRGKYEVAHYIRKELTYSHVKLLIDNGIRLNQ